MRRIVGWAIICWGIHQGNYIFLAAPILFFLSALFTLISSFAVVLIYFNKNKNEASETKERLRVTFRSIGDAVIATDSRGRITLLNTVAEDLTGWNEEEALGMPLSEVFVIVNEETRKPITTLWIKYWPKVIQLDSQTIQF